MSEETEGTSQDPQMVAELKDGQLEIVEIKYDKTDQESEELAYEGGSNDFKYMQVIDSSGKSGVLDLLNMTLIKCYDGGDTYKLVAGGGAGGETITCILSNEDDDQEEQQFMVVEEDDKSLVYLQPDGGRAPLPDPPEGGEGGPPAPLGPNQTPSPQWILEKAKTLQKSKALLASLQRRDRKGRRRKGELPPPHELLASPTFKLYLYSCKLCTFRCNAIKDLQAHKAAEHGGTGAARGGRAGSIALQCPRCPFRGHTPAQLSRHVAETHAPPPPPAASRSRSPAAAAPSPSPSRSPTPAVAYSSAVDLDSAEVDAADVLVCGACGFECAAKDEFRRHIEDEHGATAC